MDKQKMVVTVLVLVAAVLLLIGSLTLMLSGGRTHNYSELPSQSQQNTQGSESIPQDTAGTGEEKPQPGGIDAPEKETEPEKNTEPKETEGTGTGTVPGGNSGNNETPGTPVPEGPAIEVETPTNGEVDPDGEEGIPGESTEPSEPTQPSQPSQPTQPEQGGESQNPTEGTEPEQGGESQDPSQSTEPEETTKPTEPSHDDDVYDAELDADELFGGGSK